MAFPPVEQLTRVLSAMGLPPLAGVARTPGGGALQCHRLSFDGAQGDLVLGRLRWSVGHDPFQRALAAHSVLGSEEIPTVTGYQVLPPGALDLPAAVWADHGGRSARQGGVEPGRVLQDLGRILVRLVDVAVPTPGIRGDAGRFATVRGTWRADVAHLCAVERQALGAAGLSELPVVSRLTSLVEAGLDRVPEHPMPALVHFGLRPADLRYAGQGAAARLVGVDGWEHGLAGDAVASLAPLVVRLHPVHLGQVFRGAGLERCVQWLDEAAVGRLEVYAALYALGRLRDGADRVVRDGDREAAAHLDDAVDQGLRCARDGWVASQVKAGLAGESPAAWAAPSPAELLERRAVGSLARGPLPPSDRAPYILGALAASELGRAVEGELASHFVGMGHLFVDGANLGPTWLTGADGSGSGRDALVEDARKGCRGGGPAVALALLAAGLEHLGRTAGRTSAGAQLGLEAWVRGMLQRESGLRGGQGMAAAVRALHGLIGLDAARTLGLDELASTYQQQLLDAVDVLEVSTRLAQETPGDLKALLPLLGRRVGFQGEGLLVYPLVAAALRLSDADALPVPPAVVIRLCFSFVQPLGG